MMKVKQHDALFSPHYSGRMTQVASTTVATTSGSGATSYGFTNEYQNSYIKLIYLRSRMYSPLTGRFLTRDSWQGDYNRPLSLNRWNYVEGNPVNYTDPSGQYPIAGNYLSEFGVLRDGDWPTSRREELTSALRDVSARMKSAYIG